MKYLKRYADLISYDLDLEFIKTLESHVGYCIKEDLVKYNVNKISEPELPSNADETIVVIKTTAANEEVIFQFWDNTEQSTVNWGDGSSENLKPHAYDASLGHTDDYIRHSYVEPGEYTVILKGDNVTSHWVFPDAEGEYKDANGEYINWKHSLECAFPENIYKVKQLGKYFTSAYYLFYYKPNLIELGSNLFKHCINLKSLYYCFAQSEAFNKLPNGLFDNCLELIDVRGCFYGCNITEGFNLTSPGLPKLWERDGTNGIKIIHFECFCLNTNVEFLENIITEYGGYYAEPGNFTSFTIEITKAGQTINPRGLCLKLDFNSCYAIDWGDGTIENGYNDNTHTYKDIGEYKIEIKGGKFYLSADTLSIGINNLINLGPNAYFKENSSKLRYVKQLTTGCLDNCSLTSASNLFANNKWLTSLYEGAFDNLNNVTDFHCCFMGCSNLKTLPPRLLYNCINATDFSYCFCDCVSLNNIPIDLFDHCPNVTNLTYSFYNCSSLSEIPSGLFDTCATSIIDLPSCFGNCSSLTQLPDELFNNCINATNLSWCFFKCSSLSQLPNGLFKNCNNINDLSHCFKECSKLTSLPIGLFDSCVNITNLSYCFDFCSLTSLPIGLFDSCVNITNLSKCFKENNLVNISTGLFDNCINVTDFSGCFENCKSISHAYNLTSEGLPKLWERVGMEGYPGTIQGYGFAYGTSSIFREFIPTSWNGTMTI
ncbi:MAG: BspA family leucine-rich repeat surface protein, partial [Clostridia bacterium]